ncbi:hypothetical protein F4819DRAFT_351281 [Hypoxylon fuscum]|nr:hypothetical protein F4819DRAFT_351281 [Hypoxylon fuscum]
MEPSLPILSQTYRGSELINKLKLVWPNLYARTLTDRYLCNAAGVLRWMTVILESEELHMPEFAPDALLSLSLADLPCFDDAETKERIGTAISNYGPVFAGLREDGNPPNVYDILESPLMIATFWSHPRNLICRTDVWKLGTYNPPEIVDWSAEAIARRGLLQIDHPSEIFHDLDRKLGRVDVDFFSPTPPDFIRCCWHNSAQAAQAARDSNISLFEAVRSFTVRCEEVQHHEGQLTLPLRSLKYRLICIARIPSPGEEAASEHLYSCDGMCFQPEYGNESNHDWTCNDPGRYYLVYRKSRVPQDMLLNGATPLERVFIPKTYELDQLFCGWIEDSRKEKASSKSAVPRDDPPTDMQ